MKRMIIANKEDIFAMATKKQAFERSIQNSIKPLRIELLKIYLYGFSTLPNDLRHWVDNSWGYLNDIPFMDTVKGARKVDFNFLWNNTWEWTGDKTEMTFPHLIKNLRKKYPEPMWENGYNAEDFSNRFKLYLEWLCTELVKYYEDGVDKQDVNNKIVEIFKI